MYQRFRILAAFAGLVACTSLVEVAPRARSLTVTPASVTVLLDSLVHVTATVAGGTDTLVAWFVFDTTVAATSRGDVTGLNLGTTELLVAADTLSVRVPVTVVERLRAVSPGLFKNCALAADGRAECWARWTLPSIVPGPTRFVSVATGDDHACGLTAGGAAWCWGNGAIGDGTDSSRTMPVQVKDGASFQQIVSGSNFSCGLTTGGDARCWGTNTSGVLGSGNRALTPVSPASGFTFSAITAGNDHACGLTATGAVYCWGDNSLGQTGDTANTGTTYAPVRVQPLPVVTAFSAGDLHTCAMTAQGDAWCWGDNWLAQLGDSAGTGCSYYAAYYPQWLSRCSRTPLHVKGGLSFTALTMGNNHTCGLDSGHRAWCWGDNALGQFGDGGLAAGGPMPQPAASGMTFTSLAGKWNATCAVATDGRAYCWGAALGGENLGHVDKNPIRLAYQP